MTDDKGEEYIEQKSELLDKINSLLRKDGFTETEIAKIDTAVRRALGLD